MSQKPPFSIITGKSTFKRRENSLASCEIPAHDPFSNSDKVGWDPTIQSLEYSDNSEKITADCRDYDQLHLLRWNHGCFCIIRSQEEFTCKGALFYIQVYQHPVFGGTRSSCGKLDAGDEYMVHAQYEDEVEGFCYSNVGERTQ